MSAIASNTKISVSWDVVGGASSYRVLRSENSGGPYSVYAENVASNLFEDENIVDGTTYYYVVNSLYPNSTLSQNSAEASAEALVTLDLEIPIEMFDRPLASQTTDTNFKRAQSSVNIDAYDGTVTVKLEAVVSSTDTSDRLLRLVDSSNGVLGSILIPQSSVSTRIEGTLSLNSGLDWYSLEIEGSTNTGDIVVHSARLLIQQSSATKTRIQLPLLNSSSGPSNEDFLGATLSTNQSTPLQNSDFTPIKKNSDSYSELLALSPWELEALVATDLDVEGSLYLVNNTESQTVSQTFTEFSGNSVTQILTPFEDSADFFDQSYDDDLFSLSMNCSLNCDWGDAHLYKANLWVSIENMTKARLYKRLVTGGTLNSGSTQLDSNRSLVDLTFFSNPIAYLEAFASGINGLNVYLTDAGTNDSGNSGLTRVPSSQLSFSSFEETLSTGALNLDSGDRFFLETDASDGSSSLHHGHLIIDVSK